MFFGLKPAVLAIVVEAVLRISKRVLKNGRMVTLAVASFVGIFFLNLPFPLLIPSAGIIGFLGGRLSPDRFVVIKGHGKGAAEHSPSTAVEVPLHSVQPTLLRSLYVSAICLTLWIAPLTQLRQFGRKIAVFKILSAVLGS